MHKCGFTLAEYLIALVILGLIAAFTIPKILFHITLDTRYSKAQDTLGSLSEVLVKYLNENNGCFAGNITCQFSALTGEILDSRSNQALPYLEASRYENEDPIDRITQFLDGHLNYIGKIRTDWNQTFYQLPNGVVISPWGLILDRAEPNPSQWDIYLTFELYLDRNLEQVVSAQYSYIGVDTHYTLIHFSKSGRAFGGGYIVASDVISEHLQSNADIFAWPSHPQNTCTQLSGINCGI